MKKVIITGANGFVGYWLINELHKHNVEVVAIIKDCKEDISNIIRFNNIKIVFCDMANIKQLPNMLSSNEYDAFYHLAWASAGGKGRTDFSLQLKNVEHACNAVSVAKELGCKKILFAGTVTENLAFNINNSPYKSQNNIYGICKHTARCIVDIECNRLGMEYTWMQFSNLFGPYSINGNIVGYTIENILKNKDALFGPADQIYDLLYIEDLAYAAYLIGESGKKNFYYLGSGNPHILSHYLIRIGQLCKKEKNIKIGSLKDDGTRYSPDWFEIKALKEDTGFKPKYTFDEGVLKTILWMKEVF